MLYVIRVDICELGCVKDSVRAAMSTPKLPYFSVLAGLLFLPHHQYHLQHSPLSELTMFTMLQKD